MVIEVQLLKYCRSISINPYSSSIRLTKRVLMMLKVFMQIRTKGIQAHRFGDNVPPPLKHACWCACIIIL